MKVKGKVRQFIHEAEDFVVFLPPQYKLGPNWLNYLTQLLMYDQIHIPRGELWRQYGSLHIYVPPKEFILALKILAGREKDIEDCKILLQQAKVKTRLQAQQLLERYILPNAQKNNAEQIENSLVELFGIP